MTNLLIFVVVATLVAVLAISVIAQAQAQAKTTPPRHCDDDSNCIVGKSVEISTAKWNCITGIIKGALDNPTNRPDVARSIALIGLALCLQHA